MRHLAIGILALTFSAREASAALDPKEVVARKKFEVAKRSEKPLKFQERFPQSPNLEDAPSFYQRFNFPSEWKLDRSPLFEE